LLLAAVAPLAAGCGGAQGKTIKAEGVLTYKDGTPIGSAMVLFEPKDKEGRSASGFTDKDGTFELTTFNSGDGAMPGEYVVVVTKKSAAATAEAAPVAAGASGAASVTKAMKDWHSKGGSKGGALKATENTLPAVYADMKTSPLRWTIQPGGPRIELKISKS
jgi:hypothetical protein